MLQAVLPEPRLFFRSTQHAAFTLLCALPLLLAVSRAGADIAASLIGLLFVMHCAITRDWGWIREPEIRTLAALWVLMMLMSPLTPYDARQSFIVALIWGRFVLFYAALRYWLLISPSALGIAATAGMAAVLMVAIDGGWQYLTGTSLSGHDITQTGNIVNRWTRLTGMLGHPNVGNYLLKVGLPLTGVLFYYFVAHRNYRRLCWAIGAAMLILVVIMVSSERSATLLSLLGLGVIGLTLFVCRPILRRRLLLAGVLMAALVAVVVSTQPGLQHRILFSLQQLSDVENTYYGQLFKAAIGLWAQHPLTGIGAQQFRDACQENMPVLQVFFCDMHPHNIYLQWLEATGTSGFLLFVFSMLLIVRRAWRDMEFTGPSCILAAFACAGMAVVLFPLIITQSAFSNWPAILFWYSLAVSASLPRMKGLPVE